MALGRTPKATEHMVLGQDMNTANRSRDGLNVLIGQDCRVSGKLQLTGRVQVDGAVEGEIHSEGELVIGESAVVDAKVFGTTVKVFGRVNGDIECRGRLELHGGARVFGNIGSPSLVIQDGVTFEGYCSMQLGSKAESERPGDGASTKSGSSWKAGKSSEEKAATGSEAESGSA